MHAPKSKLEQFRTWSSNQLWNEKQEQWSFHGEQKQGLQDSLSVSHSFWFITAYLVLCLFFFQEYGFNSVCSVFVEKMVGQNVGWILLHVVFEIPLYNEHGRHLLGLEMLQGNK